ncbi:hypothetical protein MMC20_006785 [Loxospora ochrophaea]|nr:hypothetical protein [Loxospora ochrophaea]
MDLLWSCVSTLFICTWTVQHLDFVWPMYQGRQNTEMRRLKRAAFTLLVPEYINALAIEQFYQAKESKQMFQDLGFHNWTLRHGFFAVMNGFPVRCPADNKMYALRLGELHWLIKEKLIVEFPDLPVCEEGRLLSYKDILSERGIREASKSDTLAKTIACIQSGWLVLQSLTRVVEGQDISPLEIMTIAFVLSTFITFLFWLKKPVDLTFCKVLEAKVSRSEWWDRMCQALSTPENRKDEVVKHLYGIGDFHINGQSQFHASCTFLLGAAFGAIHCLAWNITFPSRIERILWRACGVFCTALPLYYMSTTSPVILRLAKPISALTRINLERVKDALEQLEHANAKSKLYPVVLFLTVLFMLGRLFLIVEAFISLRSLSEGVYQSVNWPKYLPHV